MRDKHHEQAEVDSCSAAGRRLGGMFLDAGISSGA
jgi:hypothetical protein